MARGQEILEDLLRRGDPLGRPRAPGTRQNQAPPTHASTRWPIERNIMSGTTVVCISFGIAAVAVALVLGGCAIWRKHGKKIEEDIEVITDAGKKLKK